MQRANIASASLVLGVLLGCASSHTSSTPATGMAPAADASGKMGAAAQNTPATPDATTTPSGGGDGHAGAGGAGGGIASSSGAPRPTAGDARTEPAAEACKALQPQRFVACAKWEPGLEDTTMDAASGISITGMVEEVSRGMWDCRGVGGFGGAELGDRPWHFKVDDGTHVLSVAVMLPWRMPLVAAGDLVTVAFHVGPDNGRFTSDSSIAIREGAGGLLLWGAEASATSALTPPEMITIADAPRGCSYEDTCGNVERAGFTLKNAAQESALGYGERTDFGDFVALHAGNDHGTPDPNACQDWWLADSMVALVRGSLNSLAARDRGTCGGSTCDADQFCKGPAGATCDSADTNAACTPTRACGSDCPGVCGCDHRFYCNACSAAAEGGVDVRVGDTSCKDSTCDPGNSLDNTGGSCALQWSCGGQRFKISCGQDVTNKGSCNCVIDGAVVHTFEPPSVTNCAADEILVACGFNPRTP